MPCKTCDHTMQCIVPKVFWCPRCGTIKTEYSGQMPRVEEEGFVPKLVEQCRGFAASISEAKITMPDLWYPSSVWDRLGISESISKDEST